MAYKKGEHKNVIVGAAAVFVSKVDSTESEWGVSGPSLPMFAGGGSAKDVLEGSDDWRNPGYTTDGVEVSYEPDFGEVTVDQELDSVRMFKQGMSVSVNTTFSEATLENLVIAWGQRSATLNGDTNLEITGGELHDDPVERALAFVGPAPRAAVGNAKRERVYHLRRALQVESSAHSLARADATTIPVSFRCLPDANPALSGGDYGNILQRTVTA